MSVENVAEGGQTPQNEDWLTKQLYEPYTGKGATDFTALEKEDSGIVPVGHNQSREYLGLLFGILAIALAVIIFNGFIFEKFFKRKQKSEEEVIADGGTAEDYRNNKAKIQNELRFHPTNYWGIAFACITAVCFYIGISLLVRWFGTYNVTLRRENVIGRDIAVAMRVGDAVKNTSNMLATYAMPTRSQETARGVLAGHLNRSLGDALRLEMNATRSKYIPEGAEWSSDPTASPMRNAAAETGNYIRSKVPSSWFTGGSGGRSESQVMAAQAAMNEDPRRVTGTGTPGAREMMETSL